AELPGGGWPAGGLTELLVPTKGIGELGLLMPALARLTCAGKRVVWLAPPYLPYAPALAAAGIDLPHLALVRAAGRRDALWAAEQALRAGSCHALLAWLPRRAGLSSRFSARCRLLPSPRPPACASCWSPLKQGCACTFSSVAAPSPGRRCSCR